jgi:hypothetical protein
VIVARPRSRYRVIQHLHCDKHHATDPQAREIFGNTHAHFAAGVAGITGILAGQ